MAFDLAALLGGETSHAAQIITASPTVNIEGVQAARMSDLVTCPVPFHGVNAIVSGSDSVFIEGLAAARVGDTTVCGSSIIPNGNALTVRIG